MKSQDSDREFIQNLCIAIAFWALAYFYHVYFS